MTIAANQRVVLEKTTPKYTAYVRDAEGVVIPAADLTTLTLSLKNKADSSTINSRSALSALNANDVTVHATSGLVTWQTVVADTTLVSTSLALGETEERVYTFIWTYGGGVKRGTHEESFFVKNALSVT